jgi:hypothetical protein
MTNKICERKQFKCKYCNNKLSSKNAMYRHIRMNCKIKKAIDKNKNDIYERLIKLEKENNKQTLENIKLKEQMIGMQKSYGKKRYETIVNNTNNINNGTINNNNIILVGYGKEDIMKLDKDEIIKILKNGFYSTLKLTEALHFNPKYPEYQSVYISNIKDKYAMMYDGNNWTLTMKEDLINKIYNDKKTYIEENLEDFADSLTESRKKALARWLEINDDDDNKIKEIKNEIKLLLYNKREIPMKSQKLI